MSRNTCVCAHTHCPCYLPGSRTSQWLGSMNIPVLSCPDLPVGSDPSPSGNSLGFCSTSLFTCPSPLWHHFSACLRSPGVTPEPCLFSPHWAPPRASACEVLSADGSPSSLPLRSSNTQWTLRTGTRSPPVQSAIPLPLTVSPLWLK